MIGRRLVSGLALVAVSALVGCLPGGMSDLHAFIEEVKARPPGPIAPLPEIQPVDSFAFEPDGRRDPFVMDTRSQVAGKVDNGLAPDPRRPKEELEGYALDSLRMVGTLFQEGTRWALVRTREGLIHRVRVGNYLGMNNGRIIEIGDTEIRLTEIVSDAPGEWRERSAALALTQ